MSAHGTRKKGQSASLFDPELEHRPPETRWREWMNRVEAVIFAASEPVSRVDLVRVVGRNCNIDLVIDDIREDLLASPINAADLLGGGNA